MREQTERNRAVVVRSERHQVSVSRLAGDDVRLDICDGGAADAERG